MLEAMKSMRAARLDPVAIYHSHPSSLPVPSKRDRAENEYGDVPHLIVGLSGPVSEIRVWQITKDGCEEINWAVSDTAS
jgi:proteasome lid subunit RPN8/RPN11